MNNERTTADCVIPYRTHFFINTSMNNAIHEKLFMLYGINKQTKISEIFTVNITTLIRHLFTCFYFDKYFDVI